MINKVILLGYLGKNPETHHIDGGNQVSSFSVATTETWNNKEGQKQEKTEWHNCVIWGGLSKVAEKYLKKGDKVYLEGKNVTRSYEDKDGVKKYTTEVVCNELKMLSTKKDAGS